jgi:hypothetical protein
MAMKKLRASRIIRTASASILRQEFLPGERAAYLRAQLLDPPAIGVLYRSRHPHQPVPVQAAVEVEAAEAEAVEAAAGNLAAANLFGLCCALF